MPDSSVPKLTFTDTGLVLPSDSDLLAGVQADMNSAFGGNLNPALATPQGQLATSQAAIISDKNAQFALFVNQVDPDTADGFMQDAIARIYFLTRRPATSTAVIVTCLGLVGVSIPVGSLVADSSGNLYSSTLAGNIGVGGTVDLPFSAVVTGPITCPPGAIAGAPYRTIPGWDRATNANAGVTGVLVERRADFEYRRRNSVAINGAGYLAAIYANVFDLPGVSDVYATENTTSATITVGSSAFPLVAHSLYVAVVGGVAADIARAIWSRKDGGCDYNGNTTVNVTDQSGYQAPFPTYPVTFEIPNPYAIKFAVTLVNDSSLPSDIVTRVQTAIVNAFSGLDGGQRARIGATIFASRFYAPVIMSASNVAILSLLVGHTSASAASVTVGIDQAPTVTASDITVSLV